MQISNPILLFFLCQFSYSIPTHLTCCFSPCNSCITDNSSVRRISLHIIAYAIVNHEQKQRYAHHCAIRSKRYPDLKNVEIKILNDSDMSLEDIRKIVDLINQVENKLSPASNKKRKIFSGNIEFVFDNKNHSCDILSAASMHHLDTIARSSMESLKWINPKSNVCLPPEEETIITNTLNKYIEKYKTEPKEEATISTKGKIDCCILQIVTSI